MTDQEILTTLGLQNASDEVKAQLLSQIGLIAEKRMSGLLDESMTDEQQAAFSDLQQSSTPEGVTNWLSAEFGNLQEIYDATVRDYVDELAQKMNIQ